MSPGAALRPALRPVDAPVEKAGRGAGPPSRGPLIRRLGPVVAGVLVGSTAVVALVSWALVSGPPALDEATRRAADRFLDGYMDPDGRVVRRDQGGDTVSEGQAYAMLVAQATGDRRRFDLAWGWARRHLQRPDGLLAWHWSDGRVHDPMPAADADLDAAWALVLASSRFDDEGLRDEGLRLGSAVLEHETAPTGDGAVLVAGPWARSRPLVVNPSYVSPGALGALARETGDVRWRSLLTTSAEHLRRLMVPGRPLPPDWAHLPPGGDLEPSPAPGQEGDGPRYGPDAARLLARVAPCGEPWSALAGSAWPVLAGTPGADVAVATDLQGRTLDAAPHPVKAVAAASAAHAAGEAGARDGLLSRAEALDRESPTYYGAAWTALGRLLLGSSLGDDCAGLGPTRP